MKRKIIEINEDLCDGCGQCIDGCHEGALALVDGKAKLVKDFFCDGLGACIGDCPTGALKIVEREAAAYDEEAVAVHLAKSASGGAGHGHPHHAHAHAHAHASGGGCPGSAMRTLNPAHAAQAQGPATADQPPPSQLGQWPVQLMLVPPHAPFLKGSDLVICADCVPFTVADFHARYLAGRSVVVGCPKLDDLGHYAQKLADMVEQARPSRVTAVIMEVPCCRGLAQVVMDAVSRSGLDIPVEIHVAGIRGGIDRQVAR